MPDELVAGRAPPLRGVRLRRRARRAGRARRSWPGRRSRSGRRSRRVGWAPRVGAWSGRRPWPRARALRTTCQYASRADERHRGRHDEDDQQEQEAAARIRASQHGRSIDQRAGRTSGSPSWPRPASRASLRMAGLVAEPAEVGLEVLARAPRVVLLELRGGRCRSWCADTRTLLGSEKNASRKATTMHAQDAGRAGWARAGRERPSGPRRRGRAARDRRSVATLQPRDARAARWCAGVRPRRRPSSVAQREAEARARGIEEGEAGRTAPVGPQSSSSKSTPS